MRRFSVSSRVFQQAQQLLPTLNSSILSELLPKKFYEPQNDWMALSKSNHRQKAIETLAVCFANIELGKLNHAEILFHRHWRQNQQEMKHLIDVTIFDAFCKAFLDIYAFNPDAENKAREWFDAIPSFGLEPQTSTYAIWVHFYLNHSKLDKAGEMLEQMQQKGIPHSKLLLEPLFQAPEDKLLLETFLKSLEQPSAQDQNDSLLLSALMDAEKTEMHLPEQNDYTADEWQQILDLKHQPLQSTNSSGVILLKDAADSIVNLKAVNKYNQQLWIEQRSYNIALEHWKVMEKQMPEDAKTKHPIPKNLLTKWHKTMTDNINALIEQQPQEHQLILPFVQLLPSEHITSIVIGELLRVPFRKKDDEKEELSQFGKTTALQMAQSIGRAIQREYAVQQLSKPENRKHLNLKMKIHKLHTQGRLFNMAFRKIMSEFAQTQGNKWDPNWGDHVVVQLGACLMDLFLKHCTIPVRKPVDAGFVVEEMPAIRHVTEITLGKRYGMLVYDPAMYEIISSNPVNVAPWCLPMVIPPLPWLTWNSGGYIQYRTESVRINHNFEHKQFIKSADQANHMVFMHKALDVLGSVPWVVNHRIFQVAAHYWNTGEAVPGIPALQHPPEIQPPKTEDPKEMRQYQNDLKNRDKEIRNSFSQRCDVNYKLDIARAFLGEVMYFPHNVDFRGRAYPMPPHLNHMGNDLCRGLLKFQQKRTIGARGLEWLKIQVSNLAGNDKVSMQERIDFCDAHLEDVLDSARNPIRGKQWWKKADNPWQLLATCMELEEALKLPDPTQFMSNLPIHQDGSCNGLQHYAALGGDILGAQAVNLIPSDKPGDVYSGVAKFVQQRVDRDCDDNVPEALIMKTRINRKLVKQTVMTNTYGVTFVGARQQVQNRLKEQREKDPVETRLTDDEISRCSKYITLKIFESMSDMFEGARELQKWLNTVAKLIAQSVDESQLNEQQLEDAKQLEFMGVLEQEKVDILEAVQEDLGFDEELTGSELGKAIPQGSILKLKKPMQTTSVTWTTPLGMPIVQPYRKYSLSEVRTQLQSFSVRDTTKKSPVNWQKQSSAFPPNYVHSLDASHMMLSAVACHQKNICFAAVHDSYWTHPSDVDEMSKLLRESFVQLHSQDLMGRLETEFNSRYQHKRIPTTVVLKDKRELDQWNQYLSNTGRKATKSKSKTIKTWRRFQLPPLPKRGDFNVEAVRESVYFFH